VCLAVIWGVTPSITVVGEIDCEWKEDSAVSMRTNPIFLKLACKLYQGVVPYAPYEFEWNKSGDVVHLPGVGLQLFPMPHFEFNLFYQKNLSPITQDTDEAMGLLHYYL
jgi:hypothetical protein